ncbi:MAG: GreA/GreB family elongation factor [Gammaproteobacteria bacterium]|jgi:regulator of nucleoside diphosphate kinase|nr:GreA/GreB family elongation factor [Gammaproteobacteria bacterium]MBU1353639.1 GreA/GreB family elongation factor [Gammaproteobacteria bacterium]MBU1508591.1 GreA/GreB family elongation factor [Gammaproteobacteria bacterium]MBU2119648.1 GreA/GreB family elongation factor [Gammaproteobacteria bacterium]MBU2202243.1 GreA/GreB family elongation factor [Gammaproteobacteria bacterium]
MTAAAAAVGVVVVVHGERTLTDLDYSRLTKLVNRQVPPVLDDLLANAEVTSSRTVQADVVTMYSRVELVDVHTHRRQVLTICYPQDAEPAAGFISVLSPVGISLLGLRTGDVAKWHTPHGEECAAVVESIQFQPEATGDYLT